MSALKTSSTMLKFTIIFCVLVSITIAHPFFDSNRIVNGENATPSDFPFMVSLRYLGKHSCGGSILGKKHILTAAHCVDGRKPESLTIQFGVTNINSNLNIIKVTAIKIHENFDTFAYNSHDVAVLKVAEEINFDGYKEVILPIQDELLPAGQLARLAGWGLDKSGGNVQMDLKWVEIRICTDEQCSAAHGSMVDTKFHLCAGIPEGGKGQCSGDSGGPLISQADMKQWGIVSWSVKPCTAKGYPGVFALVSSYSDWINRQLIIL